MRFAIVGAGALGTILAAALENAGHAVQVLARGQRFAQIKTAGLNVEGVQNWRGACDAVDDPNQVGPADVIIFAVKSQDNEAAAQALAHLQPRAVFSVANGVKKADELVAAFSQPAALGCMADFSGELLGDGKVIFTRNVGLYLGHAANGATAVVQELVEALASAGLAARVSDEIETVEWSKFVGWVGLVALSVISRLPTGRFLGDPDFAQILLQVIRETAQLAEKRSIRLADQSPVPAATIAYGNAKDARNAVAQMAEQFHTQAPNHLMSSLQDFQKGKVLEHEATMGYAVRACRDAGLAAPTLEVCYRLVCGLSRTHCT